MKPLTILLLLATNGLFAKPIRIVVSDLFGSAKFVGEVVVCAYDGKGLIYFQSTQFSDTIHQASCGSLINDKSSFANPYSDRGTCKLPFIGDTVLAVVNGYNVTSVFGKRIGNHYRLWSTLYSGSIALFDFEKPIIALNEEDILHPLNDIDTATTTCWDGCLVPVNQLSELVKTYTDRVNKKLTTVNLDKHKGKEALYIFYDDTLRLINGLLWTDEPPGKMKSLLLTYSNGKVLEITPFLNKDSPRQFDERKHFDMEKFKKMTIKNIRWTN